MNGRRAARSRDAQYDRNDRDEENEQQIEPEEAAERAQFGAAERDMRERRSLPDAQGLLGERDADHRHQKHRKESKQERQSDARAARRQAALQTVGKGVIVGAQREKTRDRIDKGRNPDQSDDGADFSKRERVGEAHGLAHWNLVHA